MTKLEKLQIRSDFELNSILEKFLNFFTSEGIKFSKSYNRGIFGSHQSKLGPNFF